MKNSEELICIDIGAEEGYFICLRKPTTLIKCSILLAQVITPTNGDPNPELELYPISLRLFRHSPPPTRGGITTWTGVGFGLSSFGFGTNSLTTPHAPPKRYLAYLATFSRMNTIQQVHQFAFKSPLNFNLICNNL